MNHVIRVVIRITHPWPAALVLVCILASLTLSASVIDPELVMGKQVLAAAFTPATAGRHFYVTYTTYTTTQAVTACSTGYHLASLWEILDVSHLTYDYDQPVAKTFLNSGYGPASSWVGWVRTGNDASTANIPGTGNCGNWSSFSSSDYGTAVSLSNLWASAPGDIFSWNATSLTCDTLAPVWCVGDFYRVYLPLIEK